MADTNTDVGISSRAIRLGKIIDRLPSGEFIIVLKKALVKDRAWKTTVYKTDKVREMDIERWSN